MMNSIRAAQHPHTFVYSGWEVNSKGNPLAHAILRGSVDKTGRLSPTIITRTCANLPICTRKAVLKILPSSWIPIIQTPQKIFRATSYRKRSVAQHAPIARYKRNRQRAYDRVVHRRGRAIPRRRRVRQIHHRSVPWLARHRTTDLELAEQV